MDLNGLEIGCFFTILTLCGEFDKKPALCGFFWDVPTLGQNCSKIFAGKKNINNKNILISKSC